MTPEEIRDLYIEALARFSYKINQQQPPWAEASAEQRKPWLDGESEYVDALAEAGLLPVAADHRWAYEPDGTPLGYRERQFLTEWQDAAVACSSCGVTERQCGRWRGGDNCCPECRHPTRRKVSE